jgi:hypothetical protein
MDTNLATQHKDTDKGLVVLAVHIVSQMRGTAKLDLVNLALDKGLASDKELDLQDKRATAKSQDTVKARMVRVLGKPDLRNKATA